MLYESIKKLVQYGINTGLTPESERIYTTNLLLDLFKENNYEDTDCDLDNIVLEDVLADLLNEAVARGIIEDSIGYRDLFDTKIMNCLMPRPAQVQDAFWKKYEESPEKATAFYYKLSQDSDYIRRYRIKKDRKWTVDTEYGTLDITINLSKPEKDPKAIAAAGKAKSSAYPKCQLCMENEDMQDAWITRHVKTTVSSRSRSRTENGDSSILHMYIITSIVSYSTDSTFQ